MQCTTQGTGLKNYTLLCPPLYEYPTYSKVITLIKQLQQFELNPPGHTHTQMNMV